ncbi:MAG: DNA polymerase III subunit delta' [Rhodospirillales bacterium]|nr:MAG: DNA polymerase III subunit delta' [Rhodospirillales bacterium]
MSRPTAAAPVETAAFPRPRANPHLEGQDAAERSLLAAYSSGRLHHAWLITGPAGIGKATLAFRFARFLLTAKVGQGALPASEPSLFGEPGRAAAPESGLPPSLAIPPDHPVFRRVAAGGHADLITVERAINDKTGKLRSEIVVDDVRAVGGLIGHTPAEGGWRVVIVDAADELNRNAANALLKALEEPPVRTVLLLVSHAPGRLLPTIRSRCRRLALQPLTSGTVESLLRRYRPDLNETDRRTLAVLADGSIGRALGLADADGLAIHAELSGLLARLPELDMVALDRLGERVGKAGGEPLFDLVESFLRDWLRRMVRYAATEGEGGPAPTDPRERALLARLAAAASLDRWLQVWENARDLLARVDSANLDRKQVMFTLLLDLQDAVRR